MCVHNSYCFFVCGADYLISTCMSYHQLTPLDLIHEAIHCMLWGALFSIFIPFCKNLSPKAKICLLKTVLRLYASSQLLLVEMTAAYAMFARVGEEGNIMPLFKNCQYLGSVPGCTAMGLKLQIWSLAFRGFVKQVDCSAIKEVRIRSNIVIISRTITMNTERTVNAV